MVTEHILYLPDVAIAAEQGAVVDFPAEHSWYFSKGTPINVNATFASALERVMPDPEFQSAPDKSGIPAIFYGPDAASLRMFDIYDTLTSAAALIRERTQGSENSPCSYFHTHFLC